MHYPDLADRCQIASGATVRAVGWLALDHSYPVGACAPEILPILRRLATEGWVPFVAAGFHECELCPGEPHREGANILLPSEGLLYAAPAMITHYVDAHGYAPPLAFVEAALACPPPKTRAYVEALRPFIGLWGTHVDERALEAYLQR